MNKIFLLLVLLNISFNVYAQKKFYTAEDDLFTLLIPVDTKIRTTEDSMVGKVKHLMFSNGKIPSFVMSFSFENSDSSSISSSVKIIENLSEQTKSNVNLNGIFHGTNYTGTKFTLDNFLEDSIKIGYYFLIPGINNDITLNLSVLFLKDDDITISFFKEVMETLVVNF